MLSRLVSFIDRLSGATGLVGASLVLPIAAVMFLGATYWHYRLPEKNFFGLIDVPAAVYDIREGWEATEPAAKTGD